MVCKFYKFSSDDCTISITLLLNRSTSSHTFPSILKCAKVIALFKSGDKESATNYRPISFLPTLSKLLERAFHIQLYESLARNKLLDKKQYGFFPKCSTKHCCPTLLMRSLLRWKMGNCVVCFSTSPKLSVRSFTAFFLLNCWLLASVTKT